MTQISDRVNDRNPLGRCFHCGKPIHYKDKYCAACGQKNEGWLETTQEQCGHCHTRLSPDDKYCRLCGTKVGDGAYEPYQDLMECIYGPAPAERTHTCQKCGYTWTTCAMIESEKYCPKCGGPAPYYDPEETQIPLKAPIVIRNPHDGSIEIRSSHEDSDAAQKPRSFWQKLTGFWRK